MTGAMFRLRLSVNTFGKFVARTRAGGCRRLQSSAHTTPSRTQTYASSLSGAYTCVYHGGFTHTIVVFGGRSETRVIPLSDST